MRALFSEQRVLYVCMFMLGCDLSECPGFNPSAHIGCAMRKGPLWPELVSYQKKDGHTKRRYDTGFLEFFENSGHKGPFRVTQPFI